MTTSAKIKRVNQKKGDNARKLMLLSGHYPIAKTGDEMLWLVHDHEDRKIRDGSAFLKVQRVEEGFYRIIKLYCGSASKWYWETKARDAFVLL